MSYFTPFFAIFLALIPSIVAFARGLKNRYSIAVLNVFPGFLLGVLNLFNFLEKDLNLSVDLEYFGWLITTTWLISLVWALMYERKD